MRSSKAKIAIIYHYVAHYRKGIFQKLSKNDEFEFTIISGKEVDIQITILDEAYARLPVPDGGIRWQFVRNKWIFGKFLWQKNLFSTIRENHFDAVIFIGNAYFVSNWYAALLCNLSGIKVLMWGHGFLRTERGLKGRLRAAFYRLAEGHFIYSARSIELMRKHGLGNKKLYQINNSLDYDSHLKLRQRVAHIESPYAGFDGYLKLIFVGRLIPQKELDLLLRAQDLLVKKGSKLKLYIIGDGTDRKKLESLSAELGLTDHVEFIGACFDESTLAKYIYFADICVSPGEVGLTAIHSMTFGTPVISHNNFHHQGPEYESIVEGETGDFFEQGSYKSLAKSIEKFIPLLDDRGGVREACFKMIDEYFTPDYQNRMFSRGLREVFLDA